MPRYDRSQIKKGLYMTIDSSAPGVTVRQSLPDDSDAGADRLAVVNYRHAVVVQEIAARLEAVKQQLDSYKAKRK